ncbi:unnamed protein product, partial [Nesidiocoris tenuis]
ETGERVKDLEREQIAIEEELERVRKEKEEDEQNRELEIRLGEVERNHNATLLDKCDATVRQDVAIKALLDETVSEKIQLTKQIVVLQVSTVGRQRNFQKSGFRNACHAAVALLHRC